MKATTQYISYNKTRAFSPLVNDYLSEGDLSSFYNYPASKDFVKKAIENRKKFPCNRNVLVDEIKNYYEGLTISHKTSEHIDLLAYSETFTVCTAHQPNIFTGNIYFIYKILHAIRLADELNKDFPDQHFVPIYFMGSEDADLAELGKVSLQGVTHQWKTNQTGAVGRMKVDDTLVEMLSNIDTQLSALPEGKGILDIMKQIYVVGKTIQQATLELVNELFGDYGLVVFMPDNKEFKKEFIPVFQKELENAISFNGIKSTLDKLSSRYKIQAQGRSVNLFYLIDGKRERIDADGEGFSLFESGKKISKEEMIAELNNYPERFSPNVILRPLFQEQLLPNIIFVGGGAELAYWLELKVLFETLGIHYPMLLLRNSFMVMNEVHSTELKSLGMNIADIFKSEKELTDILLQKSYRVDVNLDSEVNKLTAFYEDIMEFTASIDPGLKTHVAALRTKAINQIHELEKKLMRAEKKKYAIQVNHLLKIKSQVFPKGILQERVENFMYFASVYGIGFIKELYEHSSTFKQEFCILEK